MLRCFLPYRYLPLGRRRHSAEVIGTALTAVLGGAEP